MLAALSGSLLNRELNAPATTLKPATKSLAQD